MILECHKSAFSSVSFLYLYIHDGAKLELQSPVQGTTVTTLYIYILRGEKKT